jgi:hypothetical protein
VKVGIMYCSEGLEWAHDRVVLPNVRVYLL